MKGKVSFDGEEECKVETAKIPIKNAPTVKFTRATRGIPSKSVEKEKTPSLLDQVRDRCLPSQEAEEAQTDSEKELDNKIKNARRVREVRRNEALLEDYISLETTTQAYLDDYDIAMMTKERRRPKPMTWEDPDDVGTAQQEPSLRLDSESEAEAEAAATLDDGLDQEAFDSNARSDGRITMRIVEMGGKMAETSLDEEEDEATRAWELQQIRKGIASGSTASKRATKATRIIASAAARDSIDNKREPIPVISITAISQEIDNELGRASQSLSSLQGDTDQIRSHQVECQRTISEAEAAMTPVKDRIAVYRDLQEFVEEFAELMDTFMPQIEEMEEERCQALSSPSHQHSQEERASEWERCNLIRGKLGNPVELIEKLNSWQVAFPDSYRDSYVDLCIPQLLEPFVRLEFVYFDPLLSSNDEGPMDQRVEAALYKCLPTPPSNADVKIKVLSLFVLPWICRVVRAGFNPTRRDHYISINEIFVYFKSLSSPSLTRMLQSFKGVICDLLLSINVDDVENIVENISCIEDIANDPNVIAKFSSIKKFT